MNIPLGFQKWTPLLERMILELESSNPRGAFQLRRRRRSRCVLGRERRHGDATGKVLMKRKAEIYNLCSKGKMGIRYTIWLGDEDKFEHRQ